jgi:hypothetical protein
MRNGVEQARDWDVNLGFFSGNSAYWRVRFESSSAGVPSRVIGENSSSRSRYAVPRKPEA